MTPPITCSNRHSRNRACGLQGNRIALGYSQARLEPTHSISTLFPNFIPLRDRFKRYVDLAVCLKKNTDYRIVSRQCSAPRFLVTAIHGGLIEPGTSEIARLIAQNDLSLYLFEGMNEAVDFDSYHITSSCFDEPTLERMLPKHHTVISIHGCPDSWGPSILLGGLNTDLINKTIHRLQSVGLPVQGGNHPFPGRHPRNICNRGQTRAGLQIEIPQRMRIQSDLHPRIAQAIRMALGLPCLRPHLTGNIQP